MLSKDQAKAAADAVSLPHQQELDAAVEKNNRRKRARQFLWVLIAVIAASALLKRLW